MKNKKTTNKLHCNKVLFHLLLLVGILGFTAGIAHAAGKVKKVYDKVSCYGSLIDQSSYCRKELGRNSQVVYRTTVNGNKQTKFTFNVGYYKKPGQRYVHGYLWVKDKERYYKRKVTYDFGTYFTVNAKGPGEIGSYCEARVKGYFVANVTLAGY